MFTTFAYVDVYLDINGVTELATMKFSFENNLIDSVYETQKLVDKKRITKQLASISKTDMLLVEQAILTHLALPK